MNSLLSLTVLCLVIVSCMAWPAVPEQQQQKQHKVGKLVSFLIEGDSPAEVQDKIRKVRQTVTDVNVDIIQGGGGLGGGYGGYGGFGGAGFQQQVPNGYGAYGATPGGNIGGYGGYGGNGGGYGGYGGVPAGYQQTDVDVVVDNYGK